MIANIGQCQELWHSHMRELNERQNEFGLAAGENHDIGNECINGLEEEFEAGMSGLETLEHQLTCQWCTQVSSP